MCTLRPSTDTPIHCQIFLTRQARNGLCYALPHPHSDQNHRQSSPLASPVRALSVQHLSSGIDTPGMGKIITNLKLFFSWGKFPSSQISGPNPATVLFWREVTMSLHNQPHHLKTIMATPLGKVRFREKRKLLITRARSQSSEPSEAKFWLWNWFKQPKVK